MDSELDFDPYKILGLSDDARLPEVCSAYRKLVLKCHPDKVNDEHLKAQRQEEFKRIQQAYEFLTLTDTGGLKEYPAQPVDDKDSESVFKIRTDDGMPALSGGTYEEDSQQVDVGLPLILAGQRIMTTPDTGSDRNVMSINMAKQLGLNVGGSPSHDIFKLANGRVILCKGKVTIDFSFTCEDSLAHPIEFHFLEPLAASVIIGRAFLDATETLTSHLSRLVRTPRPRMLTSSLPRILHLNPPRRTFQCFINSIPVQANADTGAEMNLASPEFAARALFRIEPPDKRYQFVELADGSIAPIRGCFTARFNPSEKPLPETLRPRAHMKTFYVLDGLTSDVLLGRDLLFEIHAFVEQTKAFLDTDCPDLPVDLNLIAWLNRWRSKTNLKPANHSSVQDTDSAFWHNLDVDDAREQRMRQQAEANASIIPAEAERAVARAAESQRQDRYDKRRQKRIQDHEAQMALLRVKG